MKKEEFKYGMNTVAIELILRAEKQVAEGQNMPFENTGKDAAYYYYRSPVDKYVAVFESVKFSDDFLDLPVDARGRVYEWILGGYKNHEVDDPIDQYTIRHITFRELIKEGVIEFSDCSLGNGYVWEQKRIYL